MKTVKIKIYKFSELNKKAKERALEHYQENHEMTGDEEYLESIKQGLKSFNCSIGNWSIDYSSAARSYVPFTNNNDHTEELYGQRLRTWLVNNFYSVFYERKPQGEYKKRSNGKWSYDRYSKIIFVETSCPFTGYSGDEDFLDAFRKFVASPNNSDTFEDLVKEAIEDSLIAIENDYEEQMKEDYFEDLADANDYEFTGDGKRWNG